MLLWARGDASLSHSDVSQVENAGFTSKEMIEHTYIICQESDCLTAQLPHGHILIVVICVGKAWAKRSTPWSTRHMPWVCSRLSTERFCAS